VLDLEGKVHKIHPLVPLALDAGALGGHYVLPGQHLRGGGDCEEQGGKRKRNLATNLIPQVIEIICELRSGQILHTDCLIVPVGCRRSGRQREEANKTIISSKKWMRVSFHLSSDGSLRILSGELDKISSNPIPDRNGQSVNQSISN
jgi:hypothetical protein